MKGPRALDDSSITVQRLLASRMLLPATPKDEIKYEVTSFATFTCRFAQRCGCDAGHQGSLISLLVARSIIQLCASKFESKIGEGSFGEVFRGNLWGQEVRSGCFVDGLGSNDQLDAGCAEDSPNQREEDCRRVSEGGIDHAQAAASKHCRGDVISPLLVVLIRARGPRSSWAVRPPTRGAGS